MINLSNDGNLWTITLRRPDKANALTRVMLEAVAKAVESAAKEDAAALVLTGEGKVFSAGADLDEAKAGLATDPIWEVVSTAIATFPGLTIAALNGTLAGGAMGMALACDLRLAVADARFFYPVMKLGYLPQPSDPMRLAQLIGPARAKMILMAGQKIDAMTALSWGLIDQIVPNAADLAAGVQTLSADVLAAKPGHALAIKAMIR
jgi:enoyl-CoA hydratase